MKFIFYFFLLGLWLSSCDRNTADIQAFDKLLAGIQKANNRELSGLRMHNKKFLNRYLGNKEQPKSNLELINRLLNLNNATNLKFSDLFQFVEDFNSVFDDDCKINASNIKESRTNYFLLINDIVQSYCLGMGCDGGVQYSLDIAVDNSNFYARKDQVLEVFIKSRQDLNYGKFEYVLFDTLNFKAVSDDTGYFKLDTKLLEKGEHQMQIPVYAKEIFSNKTKLIRTVEMNLLLY